MARLTAKTVFIGLPEHWYGCGLQQVGITGCVFGWYNGHATLREIIDSAVDDFFAGGDCDNFPGDITEEDVQAALLACLTDQGRDDYKNSVTPDFARRFNPSSHGTPCVIFRLDYAEISS